MTDGNTTIGGGLFLIIILLVIIFSLRKKFDKTPEVIDDCSMEEQV